MYSTRWEITIRLKYERTAGIFRKIHRNANLRAVWISPPHADLSVSSFNENRVNSSNSVFTSTH